MSRFDFDGWQHGDTSAQITLTQRQVQRAQDVRRDIYDSHRHRTFALAYYMTGNEIEAETILTGTFVKAFSVVEEPKAQDVDAALLDELRSRFSLDESAAPLSPDAIQDAASSGAGLANRNVRRTDMEEAVQTLPPNERLLFLLRDVEGYTPAAIAKLLDLTESQVNRSLMSARIRMRRALVQSHQTRTEAA